MKTDSFVRITPFHIPMDTWIKVVLINPSECSIKYVRKFGYYIYYKAYFPTMSKDKVFDLAFKYHRFRDAIKGVRKDLIKVIDKPTLIEFKKTKRDIFIREYRVL